MVSAFGLQERQEMKRVIVARFTYHSFVFLTFCFLLCVVGGRANAQWAQFYFVREH